MVLTGWIATFGQALQASAKSFEALFAELDTNQIGGLNFQDFVSFNERLEIHQSKNELHIVYDQIDRRGKGKITLDQLRTAAKMRVAQTLEE